MKGSHYVCEVCRERSSNKESVCDPCLAFFNYALALWIKGAPNAKNN